MARPGMAIEEHPDIVEMRARYDFASLSRSAQVVDGLTLLAGVFLAISAWVVGFTAVGSFDLRVSNLLCGIAVALLAMGFAAAFGRTHGLAWVTVALGVWAIVSPWAILGSVAGAKEIIVNVITGGVIVVLGLATMALAQRRRPGPRLRAGD